MRNVGNTGCILATALAFFMFEGRQCRGQEPAQAGQLARVLKNLQKHGGAWSQQGLSWLLERESVGHLMFMATDARGTGGGGWYRPSQSRYDWRWLGQRLDADGPIPFKDFPGPREWFEALDKNRDGLLTKEDFEWFGDSALAK